MTDVFGLWLQSLDVSKVSSESFHTEEHRAMVAAHEERKRKVLEAEKLIARDPGRKNRKFVFTDRQLEIAMNALGVE